MNIEIGDKECFRCGLVKNNMTRHHSLSQWMKPKKNVIIPLCKDCHEELNKADLKTMLVFAYKLSKTSKELERMVAKLISDVNSHIEKESH